MMFIQTSRFGRVEIQNDDLLIFNEGILGFSNLRQFVLLEDPNDEIFVWLQSCEMPEVAFPVLEPEFFAPNYKVNLSKSDLDSLKMASAELPKNFAIITIPEDPQKMTANLKAPIVINLKQRMARQCVLQDNNLAIREPIFTMLQQRLVQSGPNIRQPNSLKDVAVTLPVAKGPEAIQ